MKRQPDSAWLLWRDSFRAKVKERLRKEKMSQVKLASALGYDSPSSASYHLSGGGTTIEFVEKVAEFWPDEFADAPQEYHAAKVGFSSGTIRDLHIQKLLVLFHNVDGIVQDGISFLESLQQGDGNGGRTR